MNTQFSSIWPIDRALSGATIPAKSEPRSDGRKGVLRILQSPSSTGASPSDCLVSYPGLHRYSRCIVKPQPTGQRLIVIRRIQV